MKKWVQRIAQYSIIFTQELSQQTKEKIYAYQPTAVILGGFILVLGSTSVN